MWSLEYHDDFEKRLTRFQKKHRQEAMNALVNLDTFFKALLAGATPRQIQRGFVHPEPKGILAIDEKGKGAHLKATRLYMYPHEETETLHVLTLGDKNSQDRDIKAASAIVEEILSFDQAAGETEDNDSTETEEREEQEEGDERFGAVG